MPANFDFLPNLFRFREFCEKKATEVLQREFRQQAAFARLPPPPPPEDPFAPQEGDYTGPIEQVKAGDILSPVRQQEYRDYLRSKGAYALANAKIASQFDR